MERDRKKRQDHTPGYRRDKGIKRKVSAAMTNGRSHRQMNEILDTVYCGRFNREHPVRGISRLSKDSPVKYTKLDKFGSPHSNVDYQIFSNCIWCGDFIQNW